MLAVNMFVEQWRDRRVFFDVALIPMLVLAVWELFDLAPRLAALVDAPLLNPVLGAVSPLLYIWVGGSWLARGFLGGPATPPRLALFMAVSFPILTYGTVVLAPLADALLAAIETEFGHAWRHGGNARADCCGTRRSYSSVMVCLRHFGGAAWRVDNLPWFTKVRAGTVNLIEALMIAWNLFKHAFGMLWRNLGAAAKISLIPFALIVVVYALVFGGMIATAQRGGEPSAGSLVLGVPVMIVVGLALGTAIAVNWHRFVLLNEPASWMPQIRTGRILAYIGRAILIGLGLGLIMGVAMLPATILGAAVGKAGAALGMIVTVTIFVFGLAAYWRLSASLPGAALEGGASIGDTWRATEGSFGTFLLLTLVLMGFGLLIGLAQVVLVMIPLLGVLVYIAAQWFFTMFGLSLLTTIYGYYVEKRDLV